MSIDCCFFGFLASDAERRTSQAGKAWTRLRVPVCAKAGEAITAASAAVASSVFMFLVSQFCINVPIAHGIWSRSGLRRNAQ